MVKRKRGRPPKIQKGRRGVSIGIARRKRYTAIIANNQERFDELLDLDIKDAQAAKLFIELFNERYRTLIEINKIIKYAQMYAVSRAVGALIYYLDNTVEVADSCQRRAAQIGRYVKMQRIKKKGK